MTESWTASATASRCTASATARRRPGIEAPRDDLRDYVVEDLQGDAAVLVTDQTGGGEEHQARRSGPGAVRRPPRRYSPPGPDDPRLVIRLRTATVQKKRRETEPLTAVSHRTETPDAYPFSLRVRLRVRPSAPIPIGRWPRRSARSSARRSSTTCECCRSPTGCRAGSRRPRRGTEDPSPGPRTSRRPSG